MYHQTDKEKQLSVRWVLIPQEQPITPAMYDDYTCTIGSFTYMGSDFGWVETTYTSK